MGESVKLYTTLNKTSLHSSKWSPATIMTASLKDLLYTKSRAITPTSGAIIPVRIKYQEICLQKINQNKVS